MKDFSVLLAATITDLEKLEYPLLLSPKLDGIRATIINGVVMSRTLKPFRNVHVQSLFGHKKYNGLDGELIIGEPNAKDVFKKTSKGVMAEKTLPDVEFWVFDDCSNPKLPYEDRINFAFKRFEDNEKIIDVPQHLVKSIEDVLSYEKLYTDMGYEGVMLRDPYAKYKYGRSTMTDKVLMKLKNFSDSDATIIGWQEQVSNENEKTLVRNGKTVRNTRMSGMEPQNKLGSFLVRDLHTGVEFNIGSGFTDSERVQFWLARGILAWRIIKYRYQASGTDMKPRFPVFLGFRDDV